MTRTFALATIAALLPLAAAAQTPSRAAASGPAFVVLTVAARADGPAAGEVTLTLPSGARIIVAATDIDGDMTRLANEARQPAIAGTPAPAPAPAASAGAAECARRWPTDFSMQAYCAKRQADDLAILRARRMTTQTEQTIRRTCAERYPADYSMQNYCEEQQLKAAGALGR
jgi:hypothetical protein